MPVRLSDAVEEPCSRVARGGARRALGRRRHRRRCGAARALALGGDALILEATGLAAASGVLFLWFAVRHLRAPTFGAANAVTLVRSVFLLLLLVLLGRESTGTLAWILVVLGAAAVALDGVDGALARRRGEASEFGARFDMEIDALLILVLAALVWQHGKAGVWILAAGLLRYLFVASSYVFPWFGAALPPSRRRQVDMRGPDRVVARRARARRRAAVECRGCARRFGAARLVVRRRRRVARAARARGEMPRATLRTACVRGAGSRSSLRCWR